LKPNRFKDDQSGTLPRKQVAVLAILLVLGVVVGAAIRGDTFEAIANVLSTPGSENGCVKTDENGATDLSLCN